VSRLTTVGEIASTESLQREHASTLERKRLAQAWASMRMSERKILAACSSPNRRTRP
jgi:hypothetical protein